MANVMWDLPDEQFIVKSENTWLRDGATYSTLSYYGPFLTERHATNRAKGYVRSAAPQGSSHSSTILVKNEVTVLRAELDFKAHKTVS